MKVPINGKHVEFKCPSCDHDIDIDIPGLKDAPLEVQQKDQNKVTMSAITICGGCALPLEMQKDDSWVILEPDKFDKLPEDVQEIIKAQIARLCADKGIKPGDAPKEKDDSPRGDIKRYYVREGNPAAMPGSIILTHDKKEWDDLLNHCVKDPKKLALWMFNSIQAMKGLKQNMEMN